MSLLKALLKLFNLKRQSIGIFEVGEVVRVDYDGVDSKGEPIVLTKFGICTDYIVRADNPIIDFDWSRAAGLVDEFYDFKDVGLPSKTFYVENTNWDRKRYPNAVAIKEYEPSTLQINKERNIERSPIGEELYVRQLQKSLI